MKTEIKQLTEIFSAVFKAIHQKSYHKLEQHNLYPGQPQLLSLIKANEGISQKDLSEKNCVTPATITGMLNKLEANHYVSRVPDANDKRIMRIYLTPEGRHLAEHAEMFLERLTEKLFDGFTEEELLTYVKLTEKMKNNLFHN